MRPDHNQQFCDYIYARGLKLTRQRRLILTAFLAHGQALSADELFRGVRAQGHAVGYVTVYRTLKLLAGSGVARDIRRDGCPTCYEPVTEGLRDALTGSGEIKTEGGDLSPCVQQPRACGVTAASSRPSMP